MNFLVGFGLFGGCVFGVGEVYMSDPFVLFFSFFFLQFLVCFVALISFCGGLCFFLF